MIFASIVAIRRILTSLKFIQHLKHFEHLVAVLGEATETLVRDYNCSSLVTSLAREGMTATSQAGTQAICSVTSSM